jgi:hypothetical protein
VTIEKGQAWGAPGRLPADGVIVRTDAEARAVVEDAMLSRSPIPVLGLLGGDLCKTLGGRGDEGRLHSDDAVTVPVDLVSVLIDGRQHWFVSHLVVRRGWWKGQIVAIMNAQWIGKWDVAPRSHPNDGVVDAFDVRLGVNDRLKALRRLPSGTHVPHPQIQERRGDELRFEFHRPTPLYLDGEHICTARYIALQVLPDALTCVV